MSAGRVRGCSMTSGWEASWFCSRGPEGLERLGRGVWVSFMVPYFCLFAGNLWCSDVLSVFVSRDECGGFCVGRPV